MPGRDWTDPRVLTHGVERGWADPETDPALINWAERQARAAIRFTVLDGRPVNPCTTTTIRYGRNRLGRWGENLAGDALVTAGGHLLLVERRDGKGWAVPGGFAELGEPGHDAAIRELGEEAGLFLPPGTTYLVLPPRYSPDDRASDEAWIVTVPVHVDFGFGFGAALPALVPDPGETLNARWFPAGSYELLTATLRAEQDGHSLLTAPCSPIFSARGRHARMPPGLSPDDLRAGRPRLPVHRAQSAFWPGGTPGYHAAAPRYAGRGA